MLHMDHVSERFFLVRAERCTCLAPDFYRLSMRMVFMFPGIPTENEDTLRTRTPSPTHCTDIWQGWHGLYLAQTVMVFY